MHTGEFLDLDYLLPIDHWKRTGNPDDVPFTQVDPFCDMAGPAPDSADEDWFTDADASRVSDCWDSARPSLAYISTPYVRGKMRLESAPAADAAEPNGVRNNEGDGAESLSTNQNVVNSLGSGERNDKVALDEETKATRAQSFFPRRRVVVQGLCWNGRSLPHLHRLVIAIPSTASAMHGNNDLKVSKQTNAGGLIAKRASNVQESLRYKADLNSDTAVLSSLPTPLSGTKRKRAGLEEDQYHTFCGNRKRRISNGRETGPT